MKKLLLIIITLSITTTLYSVEIVTQKGAEYQGTILNKKDETVRIKNDENTIIIVNKKNIDFIVNSKDDSIIGDYLEIGLNMGIPAGLNLQLSYHFDKYNLIRLTGMHLVKTYGVEFSYNLKIKNSFHTSLGFGIHGGYFDASDTSGIYKATHNGKGIVAYYGGLHFFISYRKFFFQIGPSYGKYNDYVGFMPNFMIGATHRFFPKLKL